MKVKVFILGLLFAVFFLASSSYAQVPQMMNYQGKLTTPAGAIIDTTVSMEFKIYDDSIGGTILWSEIQSSVKVEYGVFSVLLGSLNPIPFDIWGGGHRYLGVTIGTSPEMTPRKPIVSVPYAYSALTGGGWVDYDTTVSLATSTDKVGIGTTTPTEKLDVQGNIHASGSIVSGGGAIGMIPWSSGVPDVPDRLITDRHVIYIDDNPIVTNSTGFTGDIYVGIGEKSPVHHLEVTQSDNALSGNNVDAFKLGFTVFRRSTALNEAVGLGFSHAGMPGDVGAAIIHERTGAGSIGKLHFATKNSSSPNIPIRMTIDEDGKVGIGTMTPQSELDVHGTVRAEHYRCSNGGDLIYPLDATIEVVENAFGCWGIKATGGTGVNDFDWDRWNYGTNVVTGQGGNYPSGNVGIGITNPTQKLDVDGNIHASGSIMSGAGIRLASPPSDSKDGVITDDGIIYLDDETNFGPPLNDATGNIRVGIGDPDPGAFLEVSASGQANTLGRSLLKLSSDDNTHGDLVTVDQWGCVGIGTDMPTAPYLDTRTKLCVSKQSYYPDNGIFRFMVRDPAEYQEGACLQFGRTAPNLPAGRASAKIAFMGWGGYHGGLRFLPEGKFILSISDLPGPGNPQEDPDVQPPKVTVDVSGNVGIGTTAPGDKLEVLDMLAGQGGITTGNIKLGKFSNGSGLIGKVQNYMSSSYIGLADDIYIMGNKVGIGTTNPHSTLHINGSLAKAFTSAAVGYTLTASDCILATSGTGTIYLPTAIGIVGRVYTIKNTGSGTITIQPNGNETIDGGNSYSLTPQWAYVTIVSDGADWLIIGK